MGKENSQGYVTFWGDGNSLGGVDCFHLDRLGKQKGMKRKREGG